MWTSCLRSGRARVRRVTTPAPLNQQLTVFERALGGNEQLVHIDRLHEEGVRAELQTLDDGLHVGPPASGSMMTMNPNCIRC